MQNNESKRMNAKAGEGGPDLIRSLRAAAASEPIAVELFEWLRWRGKPTCPHCGKDNPAQLRNRKTGARNTRFLWECRACRKQFTARIGTVMEGSRIPLRHWAYAYWRAATSKKGVSAMEIHRQCGLSYKSALFLMHRIRFALTDPDPRKLMTIVEADETYVGGKPRPKNNQERRRDGEGQRKPHVSTKTPVAAVVERSAGDLVGQVRTKVLDKVTAKSVGDFLREHVAPGHALMTDDSPVYRSSWEWGHFSRHELVNHSMDEYVRGDVHVNTAEGFFSLVKRSMYGIWHSVSKAHLHRYIHECAFRWNTRKHDDGQRTAAAMAGGVGRRLRYEQYVVRKPAAG